MLTIKKLESNCKKGDYLVDIEEFGTGILILFSIISFIIGSIFLLSGFADIGGLENNNFAGALSSGSVGTMKILVGLILETLAIAPSAIRIIIQWTIKN